MVFNAPFTIRHGNVTGTDDLIYQRKVFYEYSEASTGGALEKKVYLKSLRPDNLLKKRHLTCNFIKKVTLVQVFSCKFCEIFKNNFFTKHLLRTAYESSFLQPVKTKYLSGFMNAKLSL